MRCERNARTPPSYFFCAEVVSSTEKEKHQPSQYYPNDIDLFDCVHWTQCVICGRLPVDPFGPARVYATGHIFIPSLPSSPSFCRAPNLPPLFSVSDRRFLARTYRPIGLRNNPLRYSVPTEGRARGKTRQRLQQAVLYEFSRPRRGTRRRLTVSVAVRGRAREEEPGTVGEEKK